MGISDINKSHLSHSASARQSSHIGAQSSRPVLRRSFASRKSSILSSLAKDVSPKQLSILQDMIQDHDNAKIRSNGDVCIKRKGLKGEIRISTKGRTSYHHPDGSITGKTANGNFFERSSDGRLKVTMPDGRMRYKAASGNMYIEKADGTFQSASPKAASQPFAPLSLEKQRTCFNVFKQKKTDKLEKLEKRSKKIIKTVDDKVAMLQEGVSSKKPRRVKAPSRRVGRLSFFHPRGSGSSKNL